MCVCVYTYLMKLHLEYNREQQQQNYKKLF